MSIDKLSTNYIYSIYTQISKIIRQLTISGKYRSKKQAWIAEDILNMFNKKKNLEDNAVIKVKNTLKNTDII